MWTLKVTGGDDAWRYQNLKGFRIAARYVFGGAPQPIGQHFVLQALAGVAMGRRRAETVEGNGPGSSILPLLGQDAQTVTLASAAGSYTLNNVTFKSIHQVRLPERTNDGAIARVRQLLLTFQYMVGDGIANHAAPPMTTNWNNHNHGPQAADGNATLSLPAGLGNGLPGGNAKGMIESSLAMNKPPHQATAAGRLRLVCFRDQNLSWLQAILALNQGNGGGGGAVGLDFQIDGMPLTGGLLDANPVQSIWVEETYGAFSFLPMVTTEELLAVENAGVESWLRVDEEELRTAGNPLGLEMNRVYERVVVRFNAGLRRELPGGHSNMAEWLVR